MRLAGISSALLAVQLHCLAGNLVGYLRDPNWYARKSPSDPYGVGYYEYAINANATQPLLADGTAATDVFGRFQISNLPAGTYNVIAWDVWWRSAMVFAVPVPASGSSATVDLRLHATMWGYPTFWEDTGYHEFGKAQLAATKADLAAAELRICCLGSSARLHETDPSKRKGQIDEAKRFIDLAQSLSAPFVRVFGDQIPRNEPKQDVVKRVLDGLAELAGHAKGSGVSVLIESHGDFCNSPILLDVLSRTTASSVGLLWDVHHTVVFGSEKPVDTLEHLGRYVQHTHLKDSQPKAGAVQYVLTGDGTIPLAETVRLLVRHGYKGFYSFEWEKRWHPEIEEPDVAFPHFVERMKTYLATSASSQPTQ
ncbi:MAG: TIM barrel protein [Verrucomicrobia bacterium]|nr:TIM barrel protein [Verrucomicrobiota bacterium]